MIKQYRQNRTFQNNERKFYRVGENGSKTYQQPDAREPEQFWSKTCQPREQNKKAEWINKMAKELEGFEEGPKVEIHIDLLKTALKKYQIGKRQPWWNTWILVQENQHHSWQTALEMKRCQQEAHVPEWMTKGRTTLIQKDTRKETAPNNYIPMMWKILTAQKREEIYFSLTVVDCSLRNRKDAAKASEALENYSTLISTS